MDLMLSTATVADLVESLSAAGVQLEVKEGALRVRTRRSALTPEIRSTLERNRDRLIEFLTGESKPALKGRGHNGLGHIVRPSRIPLSFAQHRLWFLHRIDGGTETYNIPIALRLEGELEAAALESAVQDVVARHESLRTIFEDTDDGTFQCILQATDALIRLAAEDVDESLLPQRIAQAVEARIDIAREIPVHTWLFRLNARCHVLLLVIHHTATDGWSVGPLTRDLTLSYMSRTLGRAPAFPAPVVQYADYALWQRRLLGEEKDPTSLLSSQIAFWRHALVDLPEELPLPFDHTRPAVSSFRGAVVPVVLDAELHRRLTALAQKNGASLFMVLQAGFAALLSRLGAGEDIPIGSPVAGRSRRELEDAVGLFVNTLVLRVDLSSYPSFRELIARIRKFNLEAYAHQDVPFERLVEALQPQRSLSRNPLFQVMFAFQNAPPGSMDLPGLTVSGEPLAWNTAKFDLTLNLGELRSPGSELLGIFGGLEYSLDLFEPATAERIAAHLVRLLEAATASPDTPVACLNILSPAERRQVLEVFNATSHPMPDATLPGLFETQVRQSGSATALVCGKESLTYASLNARANRLARYLRTLGAGPEGIICLMLERSVELVVAMLATIKTGAAYLPLDVDYPQERIDRIVSDAKPVVVLNASLLASLDLQEFQEVDLSDEERISTLLPLHPVYVIYTSGSTGAPKGTPNVHAGLVNRLSWIQAAISLDVGDAVLQKTPYSFDVSVWEFFWPLMTGARLVMSPPGAHRDPDHIARLVEQQRITTLHFVPSMLRAFLDDPARAARCSSLKRVLCSGEALTGDIQERFFQIFPHIELHNLYGPTEASIEVTAWKCRVEDGGKNPPIGPPIWNLRTYILDAGLEPVPAGVTGELYLAGVGLARGYLNRPGLTSERFITDPYANDSGARMYRTGDLARWTSDGAIEYLGRTDSQVKVRGFRIELGEIEAALMACPGVKQAAVIPRPDFAGGQTLFAFVSASPETQAAELRRQLLTKLPEFMVPAAISVRDRLPLNTNGKLDRRALSQEPHQPPQEDSSRSYRAPRTPEEEILCSIFAELLGLERVGLNDDFFALGGHSLMAMRLLSRLRVNLREISIRAFFEAPTVAGLAERLRAAETARPALVRQSRPERPPLSYAQRRLWFLHCMEGPSSTYNIPFAARIEGTLNVEALQDALCDVIARHETLRTVFPESGDGAFQQILSPAEAAFHLEIKDIAEAELAETLREAAAECIDISREIPLSAQLFRLAPATYVLAVIVHHIAADGWSVMPLTRDLTVAYGARLRGKSPAFQDLPVHYADYTVWQREMLGNDSDSESIAGRQIEYWRKTLAEAPPEIRLSSRTRPSQPRYCGGLVPLRLDAQLHAGLLQLAQASGASLFMVLQAGLAALLSRLGAGEDIPIGTSVVGRDEAAVEDLVGFFVNTLVLRTDISGRPSFRELVSRIRSVDLEAFANRDVPFERVVDALQPERSASRQPLFQVMLVLQNTPTVEMKLEGLKIKPEPIAWDTAKFDLTLNLGETYGISRNPLGVEGVFEYSSDLFDLQTVERMAEQLIRLLTLAVARPDAKIHELDILELEEKKHLLQRLGGMKPVTSAATVPELFEAHAARAPQAVAALSNEGTATYGELNSAANRIAHRLIELGVQPDNPVAICMDRSIEMLAGVLGILKAGATYVPLDSNLPARRRNELLLLSRARHVLTAPTYHSLFEDKVEHIVTSGCSRTENPSLRISPDHGAYVNFTSGSTGQPKGVLVPHRAIARLVIEPDFATLDASTCILHMARLSFDAATLEIWGALLNGGTVALLQSVTPSLEEISGAVTGCHVNTMWLTSGLFNQMVDHALPTLAPVRQLMAGGDLLSPRHVQKVQQAHPQCTVINGYGPTENTTFTSCYAIPRDADFNLALPIGTPIRGTGVRVLDSALQPVPLGVMGELYATGAGLARGYLNRAGATAERFVADPYSGQPGARMYRTGDLARWREDGVLLFLGRVDQQVKLRGFRIEPGEIEAALTELPGVADAKVIVRTDSESTRMLVAYLTSDLPEGSTLEEDALRSQLSDTLPAYMVPSAFVVLKTLPLTPNGKLDLVSLAAPQRNTSQKRIPQTPAEKSFRDLFQEVLSLKEVELDDSFFRLGGDSILSIQLVSRARRGGWEISVRDVFQHQTAASLALIARPIRTAQRTWDLSERSGEITPTPVMRWFFERGGPIRSFSQSMLVCLPDNADESNLIPALQALLDRHDVLRLRASRSSMFIEQPGTISEASCFTRVDVSRLDATTRFETMREAAAAANDRLDPEAGRVFEAVWFPVAQRLLLTIHHMAVDGVSWRILLPDLAQLWHAITHDQKTAPESEATPFSVWAKHLAEQAVSPETEAELPRWERIVQSGIPFLPGVTLDPRLDTMSTTGHLRIDLPVEVTSRILTSVPAAFHAGIDDVLLTALTVALGGQPTLIDMEGHGRETEELDLTRTVGWFTKIYPVALSAGDIDLQDALNGGPALVRLFKQVKEQLRTIPAKGLGYGLLRYLNSRTQQILAQRPSPQIAFNYLGRFEGGQAAEWSSAPEALGLSSRVDPNMPLFHLLEVNAQTLDGPEGPVLSATWSWAGRHLSEARVQEISGTWMRTLEALVRSVDQRAGGHSPSDFPLVKLSQNEVERLEAQVQGMEDVLPLSSLQEGLFFHALYDEANADVYTVQVTFLFEGSFDRERMREGAQALLDRHANLRAVIVSEGVSRPLQVIPRRSPIPWSEEDLSTLPAGQRHATESAVITADRVKRFDFSTGPLLRLKLLRLGNNQHRLIFTIHHLLIDGWSMPTLIGELFTLYRETGSHSLAPVRPYRDYLAWVAAQNEEAGLSAWRAYLAGLDSPTLLTANNAPHSVPQRWEFHVPVDLTARLQSLANEQSVTLNTAVQALWAILLGRILGREDVVFGITVSGRPAELAGVDRMVGLFINTLPLRIRPDRAATFTELVQQIQQSQTSMLPSAARRAFRDTSKPGDWANSSTPWWCSKITPLDRTAFSESAKGLTLIEATAHDATHYALHLVVGPGEQLYLRLDYDPARVAQATTEAIGTRFVQLLRSAVEQPDTPPHLLQAIGTGDRKAQIEHFHQGNPEVPDLKLVTAQFETQADRNPTAPALLYGHSQLSFGELNKRANRLAHRLIEQGVRPGDLVGISMPRSMPMVVAILATLKAGAAYLPLDPGLPSARYAAILKDAAPVTVLKEEPASAAGYPETNPGLSLSLTHRAYVIYTSGSTGMPKGVMIRHREFSNYLAWAGALYETSSGCGAPVNTPLAFDATVTSLWLPLAAGKPVFLLPEENHLEALAELLISGREFTLVKLTPAHLTALAELLGPKAALVRARNFVVGGEALPGDVANFWTSRVPGLRIVNEYGPTETVVGCCVHGVANGEQVAGDVPIGIPAGNNRLTCSMPRSNRRRQTSGVSCTSEARNSASVTFIAPA